MLPLLPADRSERLLLTRTLNSISSSKTLGELKEQVLQALPMLLPCEHFVFATGRVRAHRIFISHLMYPEAISDDFLRAVIGRDGMIPPVSIDLIEHCGRPKFTTIEHLKNPVNSAEGIWAEIYLKHGITNIAWMMLPGVHRNSFTAYFFQNLPAEIVEESKLRMTLLAPYLHIALHRVLGTKRLNRHANQDPSTKLISILSSREADIAIWVARGKTNWEIGQILGISDKTVKTHMQNIFSKLQASSRAQIAALFSSE